MTYCKAVNCNGFCTFLKCEGVQVVVSLNYIHVRYTLWLQG